MVDGGWVVVVVVVVGRWVGGGWRGATHGAGTYAGEMAQQESISKLPHLKVTPGENSISSAPRCPDTPLIPDRDCLQA